MSLWNSLVVRMVWNKRMVHLLYLKITEFIRKELIQTGWKFTGRSLPHFQCSFLLSKDPWACGRTRQSRHPSDGSSHYRVFLSSHSKIDFNAKHMSFYTDHKHSRLSDSHGPIRNNKTTRVSTSDQIVAVSGCVGSLTTALPTLLHKTADLMILNYSANCSRSVYLIVTF